LAIRGAPRLSVERRGTVQPGYLKPALFTPFMADRIISAVALMLILPDAGIPYTISL